MPTIPPLLDERAPPTAQLDATSVRGTQQPSAERGAPASAAAHGPMALLATTTFVSAFLLFQVQPMIAKVILPWFGATPAVWTTCLLFFQVLLVLGYAYAHALNRRVPSSRQAIVHCTLLAGSLLLLPITPDAAWRTQQEGDPTWQILLLLCASVGAPFFMLSATGPLLQAWLAAAHPGHTPHKLYALSNAGSMLALVSYPFVVEGSLRVSTQTLTWSVAYALFAVLCGACALRLRGKGVAASGWVGADDTDAPRPRARDLARWLALSAGGSAILMATTNQVCTNVAVVPFLWVLPLALYLLTFVLCFGGDRWSSRRLVVAMLPFALFGAALVLRRGALAGLTDQVFAHAFAMFAICMCCHGELARARPAPRHLTSFYLCMAAGGALGGIAVGIVAPHVLGGFYEYPALLAAGYALLLVTGYRRGFVHDTAEGEAARPPGFLHAIEALAVVGGTYVFFTALVDAEEEAKLRASAVTWKACTAVAMVVLAAWLFVQLEVERRRRSQSRASWWSKARLAHAAHFALLLAGAAPVVATLAFEVLEDHESVRRRARDFYGVLELHRRNGADELRHGQIMHGYQVRAFRGWPTMYYGPKSGLGIAIQGHEERETAGRQFRIGMVGLGAGTVAAYANAAIDASAGREGYANAVQRTPGDLVRFYEINPTVIDWAASEFSFTADAKARGAEVEIVRGDARIALESELARGCAQRFDVLAIDAFSGDAIPVHLLTAECFDVYLAHLAPGGLLAVHISNRFLNLQPVVERLAHERGRVALYVADPSDTDHAVASSEWMIVTDDEKLMRMVREHEMPGPHYGPLWTDDFSSLFSVVRF